MRTWTGIALVFTFFCLSLQGWASTPDDWGYRFKTSLDTSGPVFNWRDISGVGQHIPMLDDDNEGPFYLGFQFPFYDRVYDSTFICSNGWLSFTSRSHQFHHFLVPNARDPNSLLSPFWTDLDPSKAGSLLVYQDVSEFVVSWLGVPHRYGLDPFTFQTIMLDDGSVLFQYLSMMDSVHLDSSSVGIENDEGNIGLNFFFDGNPKGAVEDSLAVRFFTVTHDVNPITMHSPLEMHFTSVPCNPMVSIKNYGSVSESPTVTCTIRDSSSLLPVYGDTLSVFNLNSRDTVLVTFKEWIPDEGTRLVQFITLLASNDDASLDTLQRYCRVSKHADMAFDDGAPEGWYIVSGSPTSIMGVSVRLEPPYAPFHAIRGKIFVSDTLPFEKVHLSPDDGQGRPDLDNSYGVVEWVKAQSETAWALAEFDMTISSSDDIWLTAIWLRAAIGPLVGEDMTPPIDSCSYYTVYPPIWYQRTTGDWMMRLEIDDEVGVEERVAERAEQRTVIRCSPNPFRSTTRITAVLGSGTQGSDAPPLLRVYDVAGRIIMSFPELSASNPGMSILWDGKDSHCRPLGSGTYFVDLSAGRSHWTEKVILVR